MMDRTVIDMPMCILGPLSSDWVINTRGKSAGDDTTGGGQVVYGNQPRWEATLVLSGFKRDRVLAWRAIQSKIRGRINVLRVPVSDRYRATWTELGLLASDIALLKSGGIPFDDDAEFDDGSEFSYEPTIAVSQEYTAGLDTITVDTSTVNNALQAGQWFSYDDWLYRVTSVDGSGADTSITFEPPLRRTVPVGAELTLNATALMVFASDLEGRQSLDVNGYGNATINLVEWINRS